MSSNLVYEGVGAGGVLEELSSAQAEDTEQQQHAPVLSSHQAEDTEHQHAPVPDPASGHTEQSPAEGH